MNFVFTPSQRIRQSKDFVAAFRQKSLINKWFTIHLVNSNHKFARLGMVISKKIMAKSVSRNYTKRLIRETFRLNCTQLPSLDFVVRIRRSLTKETSFEARTALLELMLSAKSP